jgi:hypothetical protein
VRSGFVFKVERGLRLALDKKIPQSSQGRLLLQIQLLSVDNEVLKTVDSCRRTREVNDVSPEHGYFLRPS